MNKKFIALIVTLTIIISAFTMVHADSPFIDIEDNWARNYIVSVYEKGLMNGTAADKFSPSDSVNKYSVLVTIAKMMNAEETVDLDELVEKYKNELEKFKVPSYAKRESAFALEKEIVTDYELDKMNQEPLATKQDICVYLGRAFNVKQDPLLPAPQLFFTDTEFILRPYRVYVDYMIKINVIDGKGDKNGYFKPDDLVTRAMFAKMLDEASIAYDEEFGELDKGYDDGSFNEDDNGETVEEGFESEDDDVSVVNVKGYIDSIIYSRKEDPKILLDVANKDIKEFYISEKLIKENIIINGQLADVYSLRPGMHVELNAQNKTVKNIATVEFSKDIDAGEAIIKEVDIINVEITVDLLDKTDDVMKEKRVFLKGARLVDVYVPDIYIEDLKKGQNINIYGVENEEGIKASLIIIK